MNRTRSLLLAFLGATQVVFLGLSIYSHYTRPQGLIAGDGKGYYSWLRSLALDGDLDFANDFQLIYPPDPVPVEPLTPAGRVANKYPVGVALVETPGFLLGHLAALVTGSSANGVSAPYQFAVTLWLQLVCLAGLVALWAAMVRLGGDPAMSAVAVATALMATNLVQYAARPALSHAPGLAMLCFGLYALAAIARPAPLWKLSALGGLFGLVTISRPSNIALAPFFLPLALPLLERNARRWAAFVAGFALLMAVQLALNSAHWGQLQFSGYVDEGFTSGLSGIVNALFSSRHGLFVYHPWYLLLIALTAMALTMRETRTLAVGALISFALLATINGMWWSWWFGDGFGNRAFIELIPVLLVPAVVWLSRANAAALPRRRREVAAVALVLTLLNGWLWSGYVLRRFPPDGQHTVAQAWLWPWH